MTTQTQHPARTVLRTVFEVLVALCVVVPLVLTELDQGDLVIGGVSIIAVCAALTRVLAIPKVEDFLRRFLPWLAAEPPAPRD